MKQKIISIGIISIFLLAGLLNFSIDVKADPSDLCDAVDNCYLEWVSPSDNFYYQTGTYFYDEDAAECTDTGGNLKGTVYNDAGTLKYHCRTTMGRNDDGWGINFWIRYKDSDSITDSYAFFTADDYSNQDTGWVSYEFTLDETADYEFIWMFSDFAGEDDTGDEIRAWVDKVEWISDSPEDDPTLTINKVGQGSTNPSVGTHTYTEGTTRTITATPASGWSFDHWSGDDIQGSTSSSESIYMDSDKSVTVHFTEDTSPEDVKWVVMCYMAGDSNLAGDLIDDICEMEDIGSTDYVKFVVLYDGDGISDSHLMEIIKDTHDLPGIASPDLDDNYAVIPRSGEVNMGDPDTLVDFCNWVKTHEPYKDADRYCLLLNDHGNAWKSEGSFVDETSDNDSLNLFELKSAIRSISNYGIDKLDVLAFDACLMASIEVMYDMQDYTQYMVASEEYILDGGFSYDDIFSDLVNDPDMNAGEFSSVFIDRANTNIFTLSVVKFDSNFDKLIDAIDDLVDAVLASNDKEAAIDSLNNTYFDVETYACDLFIGLECDQVDLYDFCVKLKSYIDD